MKNWLVDDWKDAWKWLQVNLVAFIAVAPEAYSQVQAMQAFIAPDTFRHIMAALGVLVIVNAVRKKTS